MIKKIAKFIKFIRKILFKKQVDNKYKSNEVLNNLKMLYNLIQYIDKKFKNKKEKKQFWRDFIKYGKVRQDIIIYLIKNIEHLSEKW